MKEPDSLDKLVEELTKDTTAEELLGLWIAESEDAKFWLNLLTELDC